MMSDAKRIVGIVATVLSLMIPDAVAQVPGRPAPYAILVESPFTGVVVSATSTTLTVNGEVKLIRRRMHGFNSVLDEPKLDRQDVQFSIKGATFTRDGKRCEPRDLKKGDSATVELTSPPQGSSKYVATKVTVTSKGSGAPQ